RLDGARRAEHDRRIARNVRRERRSLGLTLPCAERRQQCFARRRLANDARARSAHTAQRRLGVTVVDRLVARWLGVAFGGCRGLGFGELFLRGTARRRATPVRRGPL